MKRYTTEIYLQRAREIHGERYDYSKVVYTTAHDKIEIGCPIHGWFTQKACAHLLYGCNQCGDERGTAKRRTVLSDWIARANTKHNFRFDYSQVCFTQQHDLVDIICPKHGLFRQAANDHLKGHGCKACACEDNGQKRQGPGYETAEYVNKARLVHGDLYDYSVTQFMGFRSHITIRCRKHGDFRQFPSNHLAGNECPTCASLEVSKAQAKWLDMLGITNREVTIFIGDSYIKADGYDAETRTVYEFWGDFWHGNPEIFDPDSVNPITHTTFGQLYQNTLNKRKLITEGGYNLVEIWEQTWRNINGR